MMVDSAARHTANRSTPSDHPLRLSLSEIMHDRCIPLSGAPARVRQWVIVHETEDEDQFELWFANKRVDRNDHRPGRAVGEADDCVAIWERHNEFSTITAIRQGRAARTPIAVSSWLQDLPGRIFRSVEILVGAQCDFDWEKESRFNPSRLVSSFVFDGAARIWSDFTIQDNGSGRILVENINLQNDEVARLVQSLIEIGNYRKLALLGFPVACDLMPWITSIEVDHKCITERHHSGHADSSEILEKLSALVTKVEFKAGAARFRLGATSSYHLLTTDRLRALRETRIPGYSTLSEFVERRLLPAMRTCEIAQQRLESLSDRLNRTASLLSLEQTTELNRRNQSILASLNNRSALQLRLQSLVEGFSVFAISYYVISIVEKFVLPLGNYFGFGQSEILTAILVVPVTFATWMALAVIKRANSSKPALQALIDETS